MLKRGLRTHFVFFNLGGRAHEIGVKQVSKYLWRSTVRLIIVSLWRCHLRVLWKRF